MRNNSGRPVLRLALVVGLAGLLPHCTHFVAQAPEGFAAYDDSDPFMAVSNDGVVYRVRSADNEPEADLAFWREALERRMREAGYTVLSDNAADKEAAYYLLRLAAPVGQRDYGYDVALFVRGDKVILVEVVGDVLAVRGHWPAIEKAIGATTF